MPGVGVLDLEALDQGVADRGVLDDPAHVVEVRFGVQRRDRALEAFAVVGRAEIVEARRRAGAVFEFVRGERHRANLCVHRAPAAFDDGCAFVGGDSFGVGGQCGRDVVEGHQPGIRYRRGLGTHAAQDHRAVAVARGVEPVGDAGVAPAQHDADKTVGIHHGLVGVQARLVAAVVDGLPPRIAERVAPVHALRRCDFEDEGLIGAELPAADDGLVLARPRRSRCGRSAAGSRSVARPLRTGGRTAGCRGRSRRARRVAGRPRRPHRSDAAVDRDGIAETLDVQATTAPRPPSRRRSGARSASGVSPSIAQPVPGVLVCGQHDLEVAVGVHLEFVDQGIGGRGDPVHRLKADVAGGAPVAEQPIALTAAQAARGCRGSPGTPCPRSRCRRCWCAQRSGWDPGRNAAPRRRLRPAARAGAASPRRDRARFGSPDPNRRQSRPHRAWRAGATRPRPGPGRRLPALPASVASAMECGNHASGPWPTLTFPLSENIVFV